MLRRLFDLRDHVTNTCRLLSKVKSLTELTTEQWALLPLIIDRLTVFEQATELMSSDDYCISHLHVLIKSIERDIDKPVPQGTPAAIFQLQELLKSKYNEYLAPLLQPTSVTTVAAFLNPVHKTLSYLTDEELTTTVKYIEQQVTMAVSRPLCSLPESCLPPTPEIDHSAYDRIQETLSASVCTGKSK